MDRGDRDVSFLARHLRDMATALWGEPVPNGFANLSLLTDAADALLSLRCELRDLETHVSRWMRRPVVGSRTMIHGWGAEYLGRASGVVVWRNGRGVKS